LLAGAGSDGSDAADCESEAAAGWLGDDPEFFASLNRAKSYRLERLRAEIRSLASDAMATLRELLTSSDVASAVRLRASLAILEANAALKLDEPGPTSVEAMQSKMEHDKFVESLCG
jgi:hypothetical protein